MVAFLTSIVALVALTAATMAYGRRRPVGTPLSWGEAMVGAVVVFFLFLLAYGIVPHQWLDYGGSELGWRKDKIVFGPGDVIDKVVPFTVSYEAIKDAIAAGLYIVFLGAHIALWSMWQGRGKKKVEEIETSAFGRPLVKGS